MATKRIILLVLALANATCSLWAQASDKQKAVSIFRSLIERYHNPAGFHFSIRYRYAAADQPDKYLDSLRGDFKLSGDQYAYRLDSTEFLCNKDLTLAIYRQDRIIYLVKTAAGSKMSNPLESLDSVVLKNDSAGYRLEETKDKQIISVDFRPGDPTQSVRYTIDRHTGFIQSLSFLVPARELYDPSVRQLVSGKDKYAIIEMEFTNYRLNDVRAGELDVHRYIRKEDKGYLPLSPYESYQNHSRHA